MRLQLISWLQIAGGLILSICLPVFLLLCGASGYNLVACEDSSRSLGWALFETVAIPFVFAAEAVPLWVILSGGAMFGFFAARKRGWLSWVFGAGLLGLCVAFLLGLLLAWVSGASDSCLLKLF